MDFSTKLSQDSEYLEGQTGYCSIQRRASSQHITLVFIMLPSWMLERDTGIWHSRWLPPLQLSQIRLGLDNVVSQLD
jgi:hypothetical protein